MPPQTVNLFVFVVLDDAQVVQAGRLLVENLHLNFRGGYRGAFQYDPDFLNHPAGYPLDPVNLPLTPEIIPAGKPDTGLHGVFQDSLPGRWGNRLLAYKGDFQQHHYGPAHLLEALGTTGLGALLYSPRRILPEGPNDPSIRNRDLSTALDEATAYETDTLAPPELRFLITGGYSAGGARPKLLVMKNGIQYIAKFSSIHDHTLSQAVELEAAGLTLGCQAGLEIPDFEVSNIRNRPVLFVKRFDITKQGGRRALVSFASLLDREPTLGSYGGMAEILRRYSSRPRTDLEQLFRQMVVNVAIHNTDDHLQNFSMIHDSSGWRLSPAYDLTPSFLQTEQATSIDGRTTRLTTQHLINEGKTFGLSTSRCRTLINEIRSSLQNWPELIQDKQAIKLIGSRMRQISLHATPELLQ